MSTDTNKSLIPLIDTCKLIGVSRSGLDKLRKKDHTFPKPLKFGTSRQASAYFVSTELQAWIDTKIAERDSQ
ncbi:MAG: helix-turn-helix transcriptional regulator [Cellvibrio sp.]